MTSKPMERPPLEEWLAAEWCRTEATDAIRYALSLEAQLRAHEEAWERLTETDAKRAALGVLWNGEKPGTLDGWTDMTAALAAARSVARGESR
jgi:hypothetical protein